jgi:hypothetical protein
MNNKLLDKQNKCLSKNSQIISLNSKILGLLENMDIDYVREKALRSIQSIEDATNSIKKSLGIK